MQRTVSPLAGKPAPKSILIDVAAQLAAYADVKPDPAVPAQRVAFGTSGHRGTPLTRSFNRDHVVAISQAVCDYRAAHGIDGPVFVGFDTHAVSRPAAEDAVEVLAGNGVHSLVAPGGEFTPTPALSRAVLAYNRGRGKGLADGIVMTPSHNPPDNGGYKYNPPSGGPADTEVTAWIEKRANALLAEGLGQVKRMPIARARSGGALGDYDFREAYVTALEGIIDFAPIRGTGVRVGVDPLGGAGVHYWGRIAERYGIDLSVVSATVDPQFAFMSVDWDGQIRMDPSSAFAMQRLIALKDRYDVACACDTDHDRHGIVAPTGLIEANSYLSIMAAYLFRNRPAWGDGCAIAKTVVTTALLDRLARSLGRRLYEVPVGFKWFVAGLLDGSLGFVGEESAGASLLCRDGSVWTTDKDGIVPCLLAAEMTAREGADPAQLYAKLAEQLGRPLFDRVEAPATPAQKARLAKLSPSALRTDQLAGDKIEQVLDRAPGNGAAFGGLKAISANGWFAARPSGTEAIYKIYAESFKGRQHLDALLTEAQAIVDAALADA
jgi:phosphoglucomutase